MASFPPDRPRKSGKNHVPFGTRRLKAGQVFGRLTTVSEDGGTSAMTYRWKCKCSCGEETSTTEYSMIYSGTESCGCLGREQMTAVRMGEAEKRYINKTFGWLTVVEVLPADAKNRTYRVAAKCACGSTKRKIVNLSNLSSGRVAACCRPQFDNPGSNGLMLSVLRHLHEGATHYSKAHRIVKVLGERHAIDIETMKVTPYGKRCIDSGRFVDHSEPRAKNILTPDEKRAAVLRTFRPGGTIESVASEFGVSLKAILRWRQAFNAAIGAQISHALSNPEVADPSITFSASSVAFGDPRRRPRKLAVGDVKGRLTLVCEDGGTSLRNYMWKCRCECGNETSILEQSLRNGSTKSCGCLREQQLIPADEKLKVGSVKGRWTIIGADPESIPRRPRWKCRCACGTERSVLEFSMRYGESMSCGCLRAESLAAYRAKRTQGRIAKSA